MTDTVLTPRATTTLSADIPASDPSRRGLTDPPVLVRPRRTLAHTVGRALRAVAGIDEGILRWIWHDRARYTALGGVLVATASIAAVSMANLIGQVRPATSAWTVVPVALLWFAFVLNLDRWLVSSNHEGPRLPAFAARFGLALIFGIVIAEPLVLTAFHQAITDDIRKTRDRDLSSLRSKLLECNPTSGQVSAECRAGGFVLADTGAVTVREVLATTQAEARILRERLTRDTAETNRLNDAAQQECFGLGGRGFTNRIGEGPECRRRRAQAEAFVRTHPLAPLQSRLLRLDAGIDELTSGVATTTSDFMTSREAFIKKRIDELPQPEEEPGLLERMSALERLTRDDSTLGVAVWVIRLLFVVIDCLPVLVKFMGGSTTYDHLVAHTSNSARRQHAAGVDLVERWHRIDVDIAISHAQDRLETVREESNVAMREQKVRLDERLARAVRDAIELRRRHRSGRDFTGDAPSPTSEEGHGHHRRFAGKVDGAWGDAQIDLTDRDPEGGAPLPAPSPSSSGSFASAFGRPWPGGPNSATQGGVTESPQPREGSDDSSTR